MAMTWITEDDWYLANDPGYMKQMKRMFPEQYDYMIRSEREHPAAMCSECPFYYHLKDKSGKIYGGGCTIDEDIRIMDMNTKAADCPL